MGNNKTRIFSGTQKYVVKNTCSCVFYTSPNDPRYSRFCLSLQKTHNEKNFYTDKRHAPIAADIGLQHLQKARRRALLRHLSGFHTRYASAQTVNFLSNGRFIKDLFCYDNKWEKVVRLPSKELASIFVQDIFDPENGCIYLEKEETTFGREWDIDPISVRIVYKNKVALTTGSKFLQLHFK